MQSMQKLQDKTSLLNLLLLQQNTEQFDNLVLASTLDSTAKQQRTTFAQNFMQTCCIDLT